jgi:hypothetical protein
VRLCETYLISTVTRCWAVSDELKRSWDVLPMLPDDDLAAKLIKQVSVIYCRYSSHSNTN